MPWVASSDSAVADHAVVPKIDRGWSLALTARGAATLRDSLDTPSQPIRSRESLKCLNVLGKAKTIGRACSPAITRGGGHACEVP